jgi:hypothetical protein
MKHLIFWGAGATQSLGIRTTAEQGKFIRSITDAGDSGRPLETRVSEALGPSDTGRWHAALFDLVTILGDDAEAYESIEAIGPEQVEAMRRNWRAGADCKELRKRIMALRLLYDGRR